MRVLAGGQRIEPIESNYKNGRVIQVTSELINLFDHLISGFGLGLVIAGSRELIHGVEAALPAT